MFLKNERCKMDQMKKRIICTVVGIGLLIGTLGLGPVSSFQGNKTYSKIDIREVNPTEIIRFHVIANSDSEDDQLLKYAVRDEILKKVAPKLAKSSSLAESRKLLQEMESEILGTAQRVIQDWGKDYPVSMDFGIYSFPAKSYGTIVLPGGEYEAVKIKIGEAQGANWWCVLFPPLCFVNIEESTALPVDGKPGVPLDSAGKNQHISNEKNTTTVLTTYEGKKVGFFLERFIQ